MSEINEIEDEIARVFPRLSLLVLQIHAADRNGGSIRNFCIKRVGSLALSTSEPKRSRSVGVAARINLLAS